MRPSPTAIRPIIRVMRSLPRRPPPGVLVSTLLTVGLAWAGALPAAAQESVAVMVDDSPTASQLCERMLEHRADNLAESARIAARLLDEFGERLVPARGGDGDLFRSVREEVERALRDQPDLAARFRERESTAAQGMLDEGDLEVVFRTRLWTPAGLEAALRLAQLDAERGLGERSLRRLDRIAGHPDLAGRAADRERSLRLLASWVAGLEIGALPEPPPAASAARDSFSGSGDAPRTDGRWEVIWSRPLEESAFRRAFRDVQQLGRLVPRTAERLADDGSLLVSLPSADDETIYLNEGHVAVALDRLSRRERWRTPLEVGDVENLGAVGDPSIVTVRDGAAVTLAGHGLATTRTGSARVICLDAGSGRMRWATSLAEATADRLGDAESGSEAIFPYGAAVIDGGAVFVLARRVTNRLESVDYLASLDLEDGSLRWITRLASCGGIRLGGLRPYSSPVLDEGRVLVGSSTGVIASVDASDGGVAWLRRFEVPLRESRFGVEPWEIASPLRLGGDLLALSPDQGAVLRLDPDTGEVRERAGFDEARLGQPRYLVAARDAEGRDLLLAVGSDVVAIDPASLSTIHWSFASANPALMVDRVGVANRAGIRGRVQVAGDVLLVPGREDVVGIRLADGSETWRVPIDEPANVLFDDGQLLLVSKDAVAAVMPPTEARRRLVERQRADPRNPEWALAMVDLAIGAGDLESAVAASRDALSAVDAGRDRREREELFARLLEIDRAAGGRDPVATEARDLLAATALEPSQRLRELLTRGDWHASQDRLARASEAWQGILSDPALASERLRLDDREVSAAVAARERLRSLAEREGATVLGPSAALAALRLERARAEAATPEVLLAIAREFPLTAEASAARIDAANALRARAMPRDALLVLLEGLREGGRSAAELLRPAVETCLEEGWIEEAASLVAEVDPRGAIVRDLALPADAWNRRAARSLPRGGRLGGEPKATQPLEGRLVRFADEHAVPRDAVLLATESDLSLEREVDGRLVTAWSIPTEDSQPIVLRFGEDILMWQMLERDRPLAMRVETETGRVRWVNPSLVELLPSDPDLAARPESGQRVIPGETAPWRATEIIPAMVEDQLLLVRRNGDVISLDLEDGRRVRWRLDEVLDMVFHVESGPLGVVVAGRGRGDDGRDVPMVAWIDPEGTVRRRWTLDDGRDGGVRWIRLSPRGQVAWGTGEGVEVRSLTAGTGDADASWRCLGGTTRNSWEAWLIADRVVIREGADRLSARGIADGAAWTVGGGEAYGGPRSDGPLTVFGGLWQDAAGASVLYGDRVLRYDAEGRLVGADAVAEDRNYLLADLASDSIAVLSFRGAGPITDESGTPRTEFVYVVYRFGLDDGLRQLGPAIEVRTVGPRFDAMRIIDGWMILSSPGSSLGIPIP